MINALAVIEDAEAIAAWRERGQFVPWCQGGEFMGGFNGRNVELFKPDDTITAEDFITSLELLGFSFFAGALDGQPMLFRSDPHPLPPAWKAHAHNILDAFGRDRTAEAIAFLRKREGAPDEATPSPDFLLHNRSISFRSA